MLLGCNAWRRRDLKAKRQIGVGRVTLRPSHRDADALRRAHIEI
jgi:hypothetical protein